MRDDSDQEPEQLLNPAEDKNKQKKHLKTYNLKYGMISTIGFSLYSHSQK